MANETELYSAIVDFETRGVNSALDDAARVEKAISGIDGSVNVDVAVDDAKLNTAKDTIDDIDAAAPSVNIESDNTELEEAEGIVGRIADGLKGLAIGGAVGGIAGGAVGVLAGASGVGALLEMDEALATIEGRTGRMIPGAEQLINDLYTDGWGESRQQIADTIVEATNLGIAQDDLAEATRSAFEVTTVTGGETSETLRAMDSLVKNGLAPSFEDAADIIVTGFQNGGDRGQDFLDTLNEYSSTFSEIGLTGEEALAVIVSGTASGIDNSDRLADGLRVMRENLALVGSDPDVTAAFTNLDSLSDVDLSGLLDGYRAGTVTAGDFYNGFFTALGDANAVDPAAAQSAADKIIGTQATDFGVDAFTGITTSGAALFGPIEGAAAESAAVINNTLAQEIDTFIRNANQSIVDLLSSDEIDLDGKIEALKTGLNDALEVLKGGGSIEDAITVGLKPLGFDDEFQKLESIFGNLIIGFLDVVASVQDILGKDSSGTRAEVSRLAEQQLQFDLQLTNPEDIATALETAQGRGVANEVIAAAVQQAVNTSLSENNTAQAEAIVQGLQGAAQEVSAAELAYGDNIFATLAGAFNPAAAGATVEVPIDFGVDPAALQADIAEAQASAIELMNNASPNPGGDAGGFWSKTQTQAEDTSSWVERAKDSVLESETAVTTALTNMSDEAMRADTDIANAMTGNTVTTSFEEVAATVERTMTDAAGYLLIMTQQVEEFDDKVSTLNANMAAAFMSLSGAIGSAAANLGSALGSSTTVNVNQQFNTASDAQASAAGAISADNIRGFQ